jgi:peptide/nickel transport system substrate-binding protein/oligopeptide transport system substrate-binding protein
MSTVTQMRIRRISLAALVVVGACTGGESSPARRTLVDSRDTYDPRSLDPALSTDVPTGRAVAYLFDGLVRPDARSPDWLANGSPAGLTYTFH